MLAIIQAAGWPIWPLLALSILTLALIVERAISLRTARVAPRQLPRQVAEMLRNGQDSPDALLRLERNSALGQILADVLRVRHEPPALRLAAIEDTGRDVGRQLHRYIGALGTIAVVAPLMGLFGTVVGMIEIFGAYSPTGADPAQLAYGISVALYNTGFGILIAIPATAFHRIYRSRADNLVGDLEREASRLQRASDLAAR